MKEECQSLMFINVILTHTTAGDKGVNYCLYQSIKKSDKGVKTTMATKTDCPVLKPECTHKDYTCFYRYKEKL